MANTKKKTEEVKETVKKAAKATTAAAKKTAKATTTAAKKTATTAKKTAEKATTKISTYVEFSGKQIATEELADKVREAYKAEGNKARIKSIEIYVKPEENAAYYVINGNAEGKKIDL